MIKESCNKRGEKLLLEGIRKVVVFCSHNIKLAEGVGDVLYFCGLVAAY